MGRDAMFFAHFFPSKFLSELKINTRWNDLDFSFYLFCKEKILHRLTWYDYAVTQVTEAAKMGRDEPFCKGSRKYRHIVNILIKKSMKCINKGHF